MFKKLLFLIAGITLCVGGITHAQDLIQISDTQTWATLADGGFGANDTLQILAGGNLTITQRCGLDNGMILVVEEGGIFTMNARLDMNSRGQIIMNGGEFYNTVDFKFTDSKGEQDCHIWLYGGLMECHNIEADKTRGAWFHLGGGIIRVGAVSLHRRHDPESTEEDTWGILMIPPYEDYEVIDLGNDWKELRALPPFKPENDKTDVPLNVVLSWKTSLGFANAYNVYLGTDVNDVNEATIDNPRDVLVSAGQEHQEENTYDPPGLLEINQTYYWRIDEVNDTDPNSPLKGDIWSFTTGDYITVEDFETYNDIEEDKEGSNRIYNTWSDGYYNPNVNGSTMGYPEPNFGNEEHFVEIIIVHGGKQSGPFLYNNTTASYSEVTLPASATPVGSDWTQDGPTVLTLWFYGDPTNPATENLYIKLNGSRVNYNGDAADISAGQWIQWDISLSDFGIDLANVTELTIGTERAGATGSEGILFLDGIRLRFIEQ